MESELDKPLGQNRKRGGRRSRPRIGMRALAGGAVAALILAGSFYTAFAPENIHEGNLTAMRRAERSAAATHPTPETDASAEAGKRQEAAAVPVRPENGASGARIEKTLTGNGLTVTKITPGKRADDGPALIEAGRKIGQDPHLATEPDPELVEDTRFGKLPLRSERGARPMDVYARPWSGTRGTRIAIVVGGLGLSQTGTMNAIDELPPEITLAFAPSGNSLARWMQAARRGGHELLLQVPMEPFNYPSNDSGPHTLTVGDTEAKMMDNLHYAMGRITNYTGIMNYMGGRFMADADAMEPVMRDIAKRGLLFLDDGTAAQSLTPTLAPALGVPYATADMQIDGELERGAILKKLDALENLARREGTAIGVASAFDVSVDAITDNARPDIKLQQGDTIKVDQRLF